MNEDGKIIPRGPFKGKKIEFAPTARIDVFREIAEDFMVKIFGFDPGTYLISDESSLLDFIGLNEIDMTDIYQKIEEIYELDASGIEVGNMLEIFTRIHHQRYHLP